MSSGPHVKYLDSYKILMTVFSKTTQISKFTNILPVGAELFHADRRTDSNDEANSRVSQFCEGA
jgi:hypothetical protein